MRLFSIGSIVLNNVSTFVAMIPCSLNGGIGTRSDLTLSDLRFLTVDPTANELNELYIAVELSR